MFSNPRVENPVRRCARETPSKPMREPGRRPPLRILLKISLGELMTAARHARGKQRGVTGKRFRKPPAACKKLGGPFGRMVRVPRSGFLSVRVFRFPVYPTPGFSGPPVCRKKIDTQKVSLLLRGSNRNTVVGRTESTDQWHSLLDFVVQG